MREFYKVSRNLIDPDAMSRVEPFVRARVNRGIPYITPRQRGRKNIGKSLRAKVFEEKGNSCRYCDEPDIREIDHLVPVNRGGKNTLRNLWPCCQTCNTSKGDATFIEWLESRFRRECLKA